MNGIPRVLLDAFPPSADDFLALSAALVTDDMLRQISEADYGMDAEAHLAALRPIRDDHRVPAPMGWEPKEVLELMRWSKPGRDDWTPGSPGDRGHAIRAFCCAALLRAAAEPANADWFEGENQTLVPAIESALHLGLGLPEAAARFLTWRFPSLPGHDENRPFFAFGLIALMLLLRPRALSASEIDEMVDFVERAEIEACESATMPGPHQDSFMDMTFYTLRHAEWQTLAARLRESVTGAPRVTALARRVEGGYYSS
jgi:hypothetical protein